MTTGERLTRELAPELAANVGPALGRMVRGAGDPTHRRRSGRWWRATRTAEGPALLLVRPERRLAEAWGPGAARALDDLPGVLGAGDDVTGFEPRHPVLREAWRRRPHVRVGRTGAFLEAWTCACLEQKVTGAEAFGAHRWLTQHHGEPAPGPARERGSEAAGMLLPLSAEQWTRVRPEEFARAGVDARRARLLMLGVSRLTALERTLDDPSDVADRKLRSLPGAGVWTSAEVRQRAHGDADAWSRGDYWIGGTITLALTGRALDDDACEEVLAPYAGHRYRVQLLLETSRATPRIERRGARRALPTHTAREW